MNGKTDGDFDNHPAQVEKPAKGNSRGKDEKWWSNVKAC